MHVLGYIPDSPEPLSFSVVYCLFNDFSIEMGYSVKYGFPLNPERIRRQYRQFAGLQNTGKGGAMDCEFNIGS